MTQQSGTSGGSAATGGIAFQTRVVAYYSVIILAEAEGAPTLGLPAHATLDYVRCETGAAVDDFLVGASTGGHIFGQAKRTLNLSTKSDSELGSVVRQFVRQLVANSDQQNPARPWNAPLDPDRDRLVLFTSPEASATIRLALARVLDASRLLLPSQQLADAALTKHQKAALAAFELHSKRAWQDATGRSATDSDVRRLASLCYVSVLSVETNGTDEQAANETLRRSILQSPQQANAGWNSLLRIATELTQRRSGIDRPGLQQALLRDSILLKVQRGYARDVETLQATTATALRALLPLSTIAIGGRAIHLDRASSSALWARAQNGSMLVVGDPGAGKSGCLSDLCQTAIDTVHDVVLVLVDRFEARTERAFSNELGLAHDLTQVLCSWTGSKPGFLVFDALDAARDEHTATAIRNVIENVLSSSSRWIVIASIRKYDLRYSKKLSRLFAGTTTHEFTDEEFPSVNHLSVPVLSDAELTQLGAQSEELRGILTGAPPPLKSLLRVPFNIRLVADLLSSGVHAPQITPSRTQLDLLNSYWDHRVLREDQRRDGRERLLREVCVRLVDKLGLQIDPLSLSSEGSDRDDLLSENVLVELQASPSGVANRYRMAFSHHVLFDYAVARLLLRGDPRSLNEQLQKSKEFALFARPSIHLHLQHLWEADPAEFWAATLGVLRIPTIPSIAGLLGPAIVASEARSLGDLRPLLDLVSSNGDERAAAISFIRHLLGALIADKSPMVGPDAGPWHELAAELSLHFGPGAARLVRMILAHGLASTEAFLPQQLVAANSAGRALLTHCWTEATEEHATAAVAVQAICRTIRGGHAETADLLRKLLALDHVAQRGYIELPWVAGEVLSIASVDAELAADIYIGAFAYHDRSREQTPLGRSQIMALVSNRQQDFEHAWWQLAEAFPQFLHDQPRAAVRAIAGVVDAYVQRELEPYRGGERRAIYFEVRGRRGSIRTDHSEIWDAGLAREHDAPIRMLDALFSLLGEPSCTQDQADTVLDALVDFANSAVFWRRLLVTATEVRGSALATASELCAVHLVLVGDETSVAAGAFLQACFGDLASRQRAAIEQAVLDIPKREPPEGRTQAERTRARLLGCLTETLIAEPTRLLLLELRRAGAIPPNEPSFQFSEFSSSQVTTESHWKHLGIPVNEPANREVLELTAPVNEFASRFLNAAPPKDEALEAMNHIDALHSALTACTEGLDDTALATGWSHLASACARMARCQQLDCAEYLGTRTRELLLACATQSQPPFDAEQEAQFEKSPSWGSPAARIDAAAGLMFLTQRHTCHSTEVDAAILELSRDAVAAVRFQIAQHLLALYTSNSDFFWKLAEHFANRESNSSVLLALLKSSLDPLVGHDPVRVCSLATAIMDRAGASRQTEIQGVSLSILGDLHVYRDLAQAREVIGRCIENVPNATKASRSLVRSLRQALSHGTDTPEDAGIRLRAFRLVQSVLQRAQSELDASGIQNRSEQSDLSPSDLERGRDLASVVSEVCSQLYFASGAFALRQNDQDTPPQPIRSRFYREASGVIDALLSAPIPVGIHHLTETLASYIDEAPEMTFLRVAAAVRNGASSGYHLESLAESLIVRIVRRYLADYRPLLRDNVRCRTALMDVLDIFISAGWPSARTLTYGLEDVFR